MSALILKSATRLSKILKAYLSLAILGASAVILVELISAKPLAVLIALIAFCFGIMGIVFWAEGKKRVWAEKMARQHRRITSGIEPPKLAESLVTFVLPSRLRDPIVGDLRHEFYELLRFGERSAVTWYFIEASKIVVRVTFLWLSLRATSVLIKDVLKRDSRL